MNKPYYTLIVKYEPTDLWSIAFKQCIHPTPWSLVLDAALFHLGGSVQDGDEVERRRSEEATIICS